MTEPPALPEVDDDGNPLAPPAAGTDVADLCYLLEWARIRGFRIGPVVRIGRLQLQVQDLRQTERPRGDYADPDLGPWRAHGHDED